VAGHGGGCEHPGAGGGRKTTVTIDLTETTTGAIASALQQARQRLGGPASGMVLTLVIVTDETSQYDAVRAANEAAREHPCRVLVVITRRPTAASRLDAEIRVGETSPGETLLLRMYGPLGQHADSVVAPLLLPDTPVVTEVSFATSEGEISVTRPDGRVALLSRPGQPERRVALHRRDAPELLSEELRRLDPDEMYAESLSLLGPV